MLNNNQLDAVNLARDFLNMVYSNFIAFLLTDCYSNGSSVYTSSRGASQNSLIVWPCDFSLFCVNAYLNIVLSQNFWPNVT